MTDAAAASPSAFVRILPPRPRRRDWALAGFCAGLLLGLAEWALLWAAGVRLPPSAALPLFAGAATLVAVPATLIGVVVQRAGVVASHSILVGAVVGPILFAPAAGALLGTLLAGSTSGAPATPTRGAEAIAILFALAGAAVASLFAARTFGRLEEGGLPVSGPVVFGLVATLLAIGETVATRDAGVRVLAAAGLLLVGVAILASVAAVVSARRGAVPWPWGRVLPVMLLLAILTPLVPRALPWLLFQGDALPPGAGPPSVLLVDLGALGGQPGDVSSSRETWLGPDAAMLAEEGIRYDAVLGTGDLGLAAAILAPPGEPSVLPPIAARGYALGAFARAAGRGRALGSPHVDATPGPGGLLEAVAPRTAAGPWVLALSLDARAALGLGSAERTPAELTSDALDWLRWWRATRSVSPVFLVVDYGAAAQSSDHESIDPALHRLLDGLEQLGLSPRTLVLVGGTAPEGVAGRAHHRLVVRVPPVNAGARRDTIVDQAEDAAALAAFLRQVPDHDAEETSLRPDRLGGVL